MLYLAENGFKVYLFEGLGQGVVMRLQGRHFTHEWEKTIKAVKHVTNVFSVWKNER